MWNEDPREHAKDRDKSKTRKVNKFSRKNRIVVQGKEHPQTCIKSCFLVIVTLAITLVKRKWIVWKN